jgi:hypothetical protein
LTCEAQLPQAFRRHDTCFNTLNEQYRQYGPKVLPNDLSFDYSFLRPRPDKS